MHRIDNSKFLLFIEPDKSERSKEPINDDLTKVMQHALTKAKKGISNYSNPNDEPSFSPGANYKGVHYTPCGQTSDSCDYLLENGMITNSLAPYYLQYYRNYIPVTEMEKAVQVLNYYTT